MKQVLNIDIIHHLKSDEWFQQGILAQIARLTQQIELFNSRLEEYRKELTIASDFINNYNDDHELESNREFIVQRTNNIRFELKREYTILYFENFKPLWKRVDRWGDEQNRNLMDQLDTIIDSEVNTIVNEIIRWSDEILQA